MFPARSQASGFEFKDSHGEWHNKSAQTPDSFFVESLKRALAMSGLTTAEVEWVVTKPPGRASTPAKGGGKGGGDAKGSWRGSSGSGWRGGWQGNWHGGWGASSSWSRP